MKTVCPLVLLAILIANTAQAGGLFLNELGDFSGGRANAGAVAGTDDAGGLMHNPANGAALEGSQLFASAGVLIPSIKFDIEDASPDAGDNDGGDAGVLTPVGSLAYRHDVQSDKWSLGITLSPLAGSGLDYDQNWVGRYQVTEVSLLVLALAPTVALQITDRLAIGIAPQFYYADLELDLKVPSFLGPLEEDNDATLDGDDTGFGALLGATYQLTNETRLGLTWQSELDINFSGNLDIRSGNFPGVSAGAETDTKLTLPQRARLGLNHHFSDLLMLSLTLGWEQWSSLDNVFVSVDTAGGAALDRNWDDTWHYAAGFQYQVNRDWDMTAGVAYDTNPVDATDRTADMPVDRQVRFNAGTRYRHSDSLTFGGYINYTDLGTARIRNDFFSGDYDGENEFYTVSLYLNWLL
ncbi:MAG: outer membrane protein transport protein [Pseudomonadota bacterium]